MILPFSVKSCMKASYLTPNPLRYSAIESAVTVSDFIVTGKPNAGSSLNVVL